MKKKLFACLIALASLTLTSCMSIFDLFNYSLDRYSNNGKILSSVPAATTELVANTGKYNFMDYIKNNVYAVSSAPSIGETHILVIPIWFTDSTSFIATSKKESVRKDIENAYFGTNEETGWRSVKTYYEEESHGALTITGTVSSWYEVGRRYSDYGVDYETKNTIKLVEDATDWYFANNPTDKRTNYDKDKDGYLDGVMCIYAAPDNVSSKRDSYTNLWAYCFWIQEKSAKSVTKPGANAFFWASYDFMYSKDDSYARTATSRFGSGDTTNCMIDAHTFIHEMGHMFGLDDYYDYSDYAYEPAGGFSMQDRNVGGHDAFSSFALGWGKAYTPNETVTINLKPFTDSGEMILLSPNNDKSAVSPFDEYLLLEYYTPTGLNEFDVTHKYRNKGPVGSKESGIRLWHVDARLIYFSNIDYDVAYLTNDPTIKDGSVILAMTNSFPDGDKDHEGYLSPAGEDYYNFNMLQMIRNNPYVTYKPESGNGLRDANLFKKGESFRMVDFPKQFVNPGKLNDGSDLGYAFQVNDTNEEFASITVIKL